MIKIDLPVETYDLLFEEIFTGNIKDPYKPKMKPAFVKWFDDMDISYQLVNYKWGQFQNKSKDSPAIIFENEESAALFRLKYL